MQMSSKKHVAKLDAPEEVKEKLHKEIGRFKNTIGSQAENGVIRTYIETILEMPWNKRAEDNTDINYAKEVLEADHYGLEQVKERNPGIPGCQNTDTEGGKARSFVWWDLREQVKLLLRSLWLVLLRNRLCAFL